MSQSPHADLPTFVSHLECSMTGERYEADQVHGLSEAGRPILVRYDLPALAKAITKDQLAARTGGFWRYREFLPVRRAENVIDLGEVMTPLIPLTRMAASLGVGKGAGGGEIILKDEGRLPVAVGDFLILRAVRESGGFAIAVTDEAIMTARDQIAREEGLLLCPEGAATYAAYKDALADGRVSNQDRVVLYNCATSLKYPMPPVTRRLDRHAEIDYAAMA